MELSRSDKIATHIREIASQFIERESNKTALITVTRVEMTDRDRGATLFISVLPESGEDSALNFLKRKRPEIRDAIKRGINMRTIPFLDVAIDSGAKAERRIESLLKE
jgi:ribosome-binding factor A